MRILIYILSLIPIWILAYEKVYDVLFVYVVIIGGIITLEIIFRKQSIDYLMKDKR